MTQFLYRLGRWCAEHGWRVIAAWFLVALCVMGLNRALGGESKDSYVLKGTDSAVAQDLLNRAFPGSSAEAVPLVIHAEEDLGSGPGQLAVAAVADSARANPVVTAVSAPADNDTLLADDGRTAIVYVTVNERHATEPGVGSTLLEDATAAAGPGVEVALGGFLGRQISQPETKLSEVIGLIAAVLVLVVTLRRPVAALIPLISAMISVGLGLALVGLLSSLVFIPDVAPTLGTMLGLGVGIDYALFLITRHRALLQQGFGVPDAVGRTCGTAGAGMVFAGSTLIAALCGLVLTGISFLAWLGYAAAIVVGIAVLSSITLVPAILGVLKQRVLSASTPEFADDAALDATGWGRLADAVTGRPWVFAIGSTVLLAVLAAPTLTLTLGHADSGVLPKETTARQAYDFISEGFGPGENGPFAVTVQMYSRAKAPKNADAEQGTDPRTLDPRLQSLQDELANTPGVDSADEPIVSPDGGVAIIRTIPEWGPADPRTEELVHELRAGTLSTSVTGTSMGAHLGGVTAATTDFSEIIAARTPWFILGVVIMSFLLLMVAYRSLLIPFKAACMNLVSIAAAYGIVVVVFQWGWGASWIGLEGPVPIESYVPMMMFAVLFGLSMDYEVFLLTAFREHWERTGDMTTAVRRGLADTGRLVTAAALIMVAVFLSFLLSDNAIVKMFGIGLASAVAIDATIVRCLLVPAIMVLAQKGTWWLPAWLDTLLPQVHVEGDPRQIEEVAADTGSATHRRPLAIARPAAVVGAGVGVLVSWGLTSRLPIIPESSSTAVAMSAVLGAVLALLPAAASAGRGSARLRAFGYLLGVGLGLLVVSVLAAAVPPARALSAPVTAYAIVVTSLLAVLVVGRSLALPTALGSLSIAVGYLLSGQQQASIQVLLSVSLLPTLVTILVVSVFINLFPSREVSMEPQDDELIGAGEP